MKLPSSHSAGVFLDSMRRQTGFTLTELMVSMTIFSLVIAGMIAGHVFGLKVFQLTRSNLGAADSGRILSMRLGTDVRLAECIKIGRGDRKSFQELSPLETQEGNAIQIYRSSATNDYTRYYVDAVDGKMMSVSADGAGLKLMAEGLINQNVFRAEDAAGRTLSNRQNSFVLGVILQYSKVPGSDAPVGKGKYYDEFQWQMKVATRARQ
jgi:prepilin-type N-terminal cleavage/methylation domain-containing protein